MKIEITRNKLPGLSAAIRAAMTKVVAETTLQIQEEATILAPVDTGNLRGSITSEANGLTGEINVGADYAIHVEYGTEKSYAQPFLGPAVESAEDDFKKRIKDAMKDATR